MPVHSGPLDDIRFAGIFQNCQGLSEGNIGHIFVCSKKVRILRVKRGLLENWRRSVDNPSECISSRRTFVPNRGRGHSDADEDSV